MPAPLTVLSVNAWMQSPSGFRLEGGRAVDVEPLAALFANAYMWPQLVHMILAAYLVVGFLLAGAYAWSWLRGGRSRYVRVALTVALTAVALAAPAQIVVGDWIARQVTESQPTKLAAFEGLGETQEGAPIHIGGWYDEGSGEVEYGIPIPRRTSSRPSPGSRWSRRSGCWEASGSPCRGWWPRSGPARTPEAQASRSCSAQSSVRSAAPRRRRNNARRPARTLDAPFEVMAFAGGRLLVLARRSTHRSTIEIRRQRRGGAMRTDEPARKDRRGSGGHPDSNQDGEVIGRVVHEEPEEGAAARGRVVPDAPEPNAKRLGRVVHEESDPGARALGRVVREDPEDAA